VKQARILRKNILAGVLSKKEDGTFSFEYDENYLKIPQAQNISVNFPLQKEPFDSEYLFAFFFNMLSEGNIKTAQCANMKIDENDSFTRLLKTAKYDTIGSVSVEEIV